MGIKYYTILLAPLGFLVAISLISLGRRKRALQVAGAILAVPALMASAMFAAPIQWLLEDLIGYEQRVSVSSLEYTVSLVQKPSPDHYNTFLEIVRVEDGAEARVMIDIDLPKQNKPTVEWHDGRAYFVHFTRGRREISETTAYFDPVSKAVSANGRTETDLNALKFNQHD